MTATIEENMIDAYALALNETRYYAIEREHQPYIRKIRGVYLFDRSRQTRCCEITPSYYLMHLYDSVIYTDETPEDLIDTLDQLYGHCGGDDQYVHCHEIERIISADKPFTVAHLGKAVYRNGEPIPPEEFNYDESMKDLRESYCGNCPL